MQHKERTPRGGLSRRRTLGLMSGTALTAALGTFASAAAAQGDGSSQAYPSRPVRIIVPFPPGGGTDLAARLYTTRMPEMLGQSVVVDNRAGATGAIGTAAVAQSKPDGYTLLAGSDSSTLLGPMVSQSKLFDPIKDFTPIAIFLLNPLVMVAHPSVRGRTIAEIAATSQKEQLAYASIGEGSLFHFAGELFNNMTGAKLMHVPYKGAAPAMADVRAGHAQFMFATVGQALPFIEEGSLKAVAVTGGSRSAHLPNVQTLQEAGLKDYNIESWNGLFAPAGTPPAIIDRLAQAVRRIAQDAKFQEQVEKTGATIPLLSPAEFATLVQQQQTAYAGQYQKIEMARTKPG